MSDFDDFDDLDDLIRQLRSAATDAELAEETSHVDAMARHLRRKGHTMITSRRARVAAFVAAGVIGFGGVAAAGPGGPFALTGSDDTTTTSEATTTTSEATTTTSEATTTTSEATTTTSEATTTTSEVVVEDAPITESVIEEIPDSDGAGLIDDPATEFDETTCRPGNHGRTVSAVARDEPPYEDVEQRVAAQSSCGKDGADVADPVDQDEADVDVEADDADDRNADDRPEPRGRPDKPGRPASAGDQGNGSRKNAGG